MLRLGVAAALVLSTAALVVAALALVESRGEPNEVASTPTSVGGWTAYAPLHERAPVALEGLMTREQVVAVLGLPDDVFRKNARAECWAYTSPYAIRLCFGPKRRLAWWSVTTPPDA
jgi:hypothetical protein